MKPFKAIPTGYTASEFDGEGHSFYPCFKVTGPVTLRGVNRSNMGAREARALASALNKAHELGSKGTA